jgi:hypothetical protein
MAEKVVYYTDNDEVTSIEYESNEESIIITRIMLPDTMTREGCSVDDINCVLDELMNVFYVKKSSEVETKHLICSDRMIVAAYGSWLCYLVAWGLRLPEYPNLDSHADRLKAYNIERLRIAEQTC